MHQAKLERCGNGCCFLVDGREVTEAEYNDAVVRHPGHYPGVKPGQRNALLDTVIACRKASLTHSTLCDRHKTRMVAVRLHDPNTRFGTDGFQCAEPGCTRHYTTGRGYFDVVDERPLGDRFQQLCPKCSGKMYLREIRHDVEIWQCPSRQCGHEQQMVA